MPSAAFSLSPFTFHPSTSTLHTSHFALHTSMMPLLRLPRPALVVLAMLAACGRQADRRPGTVLLASGADLQSANPLVTTHPLAKQVQRYVLLTTLVRYDSLLQVEPYLARRWDWSEDGTLLTLTLTSALRWHDGTPTTAHDVAWTLDAARNPETGYPRATDLSQLTSVQAHDDTTVSLTFSTPQTRIPDVLTDLAIAPRHLLGSVPRADLRRAEWNEHPVGNGPFRFVTHEANRRWVFERNEDFPAELGGPPLLERLVVAVVDEPATKLAALSSGELDLAGIAPAHTAFVSRQPDLEVLDYPLLFTVSLVFNTRRPPFDRSAVRKAVARALDRTEIVDGITFGYGTPGTGPLPPELTAVVPSSQDPMTEAAGLTEESLESPLEFELLTVGSGEAALEQLVQAQLARVGISARIRQLELSAFLARVNASTPDFDAAVLGVSGDLKLGHLAFLLAVSGLSAPPGEDPLRVLAREVPVTFLYHARGIQGKRRAITGIRMDLRGELPTVTRWNTP